MNRELLDPYEDGFDDLYEDSLEPEKARTLSAQSTIDGAYRQAKENMSQELALRPEPILGGWNPRMVFDVALGVEDEDTIRERYLLSEPEFARIVQQPAFRQELQIHTKTLRESGVTFAVKAKLIAEETLEDIFGLITNTHVAAKDRITAWTKVAEFAGLTPQVSKDTQSNANQVNIQINL
jgi:hypothetical protein